MSNPSIYFRGPFSLLAPTACLLDTTPPTFSGISSLTPQNNGSFLVGWSAATDATPPISYEIYVLPGAVSAATLFAASPKTISRGTSEYLFRDSTGALLTAQLYTVGVRAVDAVGNRETNTSIMSDTSDGVLTDSLAMIANSLYNTELNLATDHTNLHQDHLDLHQDHLDLHQDHLDLVSDLSTLSSYLSTFSTDLGIFATNLSNMTTEVSTLTTDVSTLGTHLSTLATDLSNLATLVSTLSTTSSNLTTEVASMSAISTSLATSAAQVQSAASLILATVL